jgi:hypothetical protein
MVNKAQHPTRPSASSVQFTFLYNNSVRWFSVFISPLSPSYAKFLRIFINRLWRQSENTHHVGFEVLTAVVTTFRRSMSLKMEGKYSSETSADFQRNTRHFIPENRTLQHTSWQTFQVTSSQFLKFTLLIALQVHVSTVLSYKGNSVELVCQVCQCTSIFTSWALLSSFFNIFIAFIYKSETRQYIILRGQLTEIQALRNFLILKFEISPWPSKTPTTLLSLVSQTDIFQLSSYIRIFCFQWECYTSCTSHISWLYHPSKIHLGSRYSYGLRAGRLGFHSRHGKIFLLSPASRRALGPTQPLNPMGTVSSFPGGKAAGAWSWLPTSI